MKICAKYPEKAADNWRKSGVNPGNVNDSTNDNQYKTKIQINRI